MRSCWARGDLERTLSMAARRARAWLFAGGALNRRLVFAAGAATR
jgi:hypothetical protein